MSLELLFFFLTSNKFYYNLKELKGLCSSDNFDKNAQESCSKGFELDKLLLDKIRIQAKLSI